MKKLLGLFLLALGIITAGSWVAAIGQTDNCYDTLPGCLDPNFVNGKLIAPANYTIRSIAVQQVGGDYRTVTFGSQSGKATAYLVARFLPDGSLDPSFGTNGTVATSLVPSLVYPNQVAIQSYQGANKILVVGYTPGTRTTPARMALAQFTENGAVDKCFGDATCVNGGVVNVLTQWVIGSLLHVSVQPWDGKIVVAGESPWGSTSFHMVVARFNPDGSIDTGFGSNGQYVFSNELGQAFSVAFDPMHRIFVGGYIRLVASTYEPRPIMLRLTPQGQLDTTFGTNGYALLDINNEGYTAIAADAMGGVIGLGTIGLHRFDQHGLLDTAFANGNAFWQPAPTSTFAMVMQPDGKLLVGGGNDQNSNRYMTVWRFNPNGSQDPSFGVNGAVRTYIAGVTFRDVDSMVLYPDGNNVKLVVAGGSVLARYYATVAPLADDVAIDSVASDVAEVLQGDSLTIHVIAANHGTNPETATVTLVEGGNLLGSDLVTLMPGESRSLTYVWQTDLATPLGDHALVATAALNGVTDLQPANNESSTAVRVNAASSTIVLDARAYKVGRHKYADLSWSGAGTFAVDIFRDGALIITTANDGFFNDYLGDGPTKRFAYMVCEAGSTRCSNTATATF